ncbi:trypsin-like peptidase domain-containing protein [Candidatus Pacearchaeota archaeon]|nr:trypsin-like peptidase domain-containing protein [Candidatus Pacearchaeota archaeon]
MVVKYKYTQRAQPSIQQVGLKKHHKIMLGGFTGILIVYMIISSILLNGLIVKQTLNNNKVNERLNALQADTSSKINELTDIVSKTQDTLSETQKSLLSINESVKSQISSLKASVDDDFSGIIEQAVPAVVTIRTDVAQGTGFLITNDGYIVTNAHVLSGARRVSAITSNQESINAEFIGYDSDLDIALLKIPGNYEKLKLDNSDNVQVGEKVIAIGNPLGLQFSVSQGIVSGIHRQGSNGLNLYIQTDAALNPGNSGGPLINKAGKVIGINNFKIGGGENLGFALESNSIKEAVNQISQEKLQINLI